jgi:cell division transport system permease protein
MALSYSFRLAIQSILYEKWINLLSILTIAAGLLFLSITLLFVYNIDQATGKLPDKFSVMLYLNDDVTRQELDNVMNIARKDAAVERVDFIPKDEALKELRNTIKNTDLVLDSLGENPLPDTVEIKFRSASMDPEIVKRLSTRLRDIKGVHEVQYGEKFLSSVYSIRMGIQTVGIAVILLMIAGTLFVCYSTVKILFYRKEKEIETYKLLGATKGFIRAPFLIEGAVIGLSGGLLSFIGILSLYYLVILKVTLTFPFFKFIIFPVDMSFVIPLLGLLLGVTGAAIAIGRIRYRA